MSRNEPGIREDAAFLRALAQGGVEGSAKAGAILLSMANPRHEHEYRCFERHPLPAGMSLIAGVIDSTTNYVEHPEVVADRIERAARVVGDPHRIMAGTDCGFETTSGMGHVAEELVWEKSRALRDGQQLFLFSPRLLVSAVVFSVALGALAAAYATLHIVRLSPAEAIRRGS